jgi:hypothetical protein
LGSTTFAKGAFTGLNAAMIRAAGSDMSASGAGTITTAQTVLISDAPTIGSTNWALNVVSGATNLGGNTSVTGTLSTSGADTAASYSATGGSAPSVASSKVYSFVSGGIPVKQWVDAANAANARIADFVFASGSFSGRFTNDANSAATNWLSVAGNSSAITSIALTGNTAVTGTLSATGTITSSAAVYVEGSGTLYNLVDVKDTANQSGATFELHSEGYSHI